VRLTGPRSLNCGNSAGRLGISHRTVQTHLARVYVKLGITSRGEIAGHLNA